MSVPPQQAEGNGNHTAGLPWQILGEETCFEAAPWVKITRQTLRLPDGKVISDYYQSSDKSYVEILPVRENGDILGLWRYKHGPRQACWGFPAGYIEPGEEPLSAAKRELQEECALASQHWTALGSYYLDGNRTSAQAHFFVATEVFATDPLASDDLETATLHWASTDQWKQRLLQGEIATIGVAMTLAQYLLRNSR